ncbi:Glutamate or tyrosine decarboxylase [Saccharopolyspora kobensis]|uniref:Glutamate or tyrosine decarboxylase n=1 Tax=Saccharopolyspora kobensis TaxID=146035 RepID=A0A1H5XRG3_9PSEU|nr:pyridoxal-dependent decarboxylase [Saccharopolyspora kobensis]SEG14399.1 Glutamate or tyrosine decarboxylase [Saccharopolyspora kobensis]SFE38832.1 Glutamate or tyrosine decarboxylase [Saccharopolyspora kobensis]
MHPNLADDLTRLPELLDAARGCAVEMLSGMADRPVVVPPQAPPPTPLPERGTGAAGALELFRDQWASGFSASAGPRYLGAVTGGATPASLVGDWLTSAFDQNAMLGTDSVAADLERAAVGWLGELLGLPSHRGAFVSGATMSNFTGLAIAREWVAEQLGVSVAEDGVAALGAVPVLSGSPHTSIFKALSMLGLGRGCLRQVACPPGREAVDVDLLAAELAALDGRPAIVVANAGTVNTADFDDLRAISALRERFPFWLHVDAAFGGLAALSPRHAGLVAGLDEADSVCADLHKWLNVPYDSAVQFTRRRDLQVQVFQNSAPYLSAPTADPDFLHLVPENSRRLRALPAWFTLAAYGREGHREVVERDIALARELGDRIAGMPHLRLLAPVRLNVVCFTLAENPTSERVGRLNRAVTESGEAFLTPTVHEGTPGLRAAFSSWRTTASDVTRLTDVLRDEGNEPAAS